jgi:quinol monooxygenase YgiN
MTVKIVIRATLKGKDVEAIRKIHDEVTAATRHMAQEAGDISHRVYLNPQNPREFLGVDEWKSVEAGQAFASSPQIQEFFGRLFEGEPEVTVWKDSGWNQW